MHERAILTRQYELLKSSRAVVLQYCETFAETDFVKVPAGYGLGIRDLMVHVANTYLFWLADFVAGKKEVSFLDAQDYQGVADCRRLFDGVDGSVDTHIRAFADRWDTPIQGHIPWRKMSFEATPLALLTHVMTHEFHHKGQIMTMSRQMGYTPPDADILRFP